MSKASWGQRFSHFRDNFWIWTTSPSVFGSSKPFSVPFCHTRTRGLRGYLGSFFSGDQSDITFVSLFLLVEELADLSESSHRCSLSPALGSLCFLFLSRFQLQKAELVYNRWSWAPTIIFIIFL